MNTVMVIPAMIFESEVAMGTKFGTASHGGLDRAVSYDSETGESKRWSESADDWVDNGSRSSLHDAERAGARDIARGTRDFRDTRKRP